VVAALSILAEPKRVEILRLVWHRERGAGEIAREFDVTFGAISQHLGVLREAGFVAARREGRQIFYSARREALGPLAAALEAMWSERLGVLKSLAEAEQRRLDESGKPSAVAAAAGATPPPADARHHTPEARRPTTRAAVRAGSARAPRSATSKRKRNTHE
jgi:DNA-binding transcriptional ArsR family regulator